MFNILTIKDGHSVCLKLDGRLDTINSSRFLEEMQLYFEMEKYLIIDFENCNYLSSSGIRALLTATKKLNSRGGELLLANVSGEVFQVIEMTGLKNVFHIYGTIGDARKKIIDSKDQLIFKKEFELGKFKVSLKKIINQKTDYLIWNDQGIAGYDELFISAGIGSPAETLSEKEEEKGFFITLGNCSGFVPFNSDIPSDFRVLKNPSHGGIFLKWGLSFNSAPDSELQILSEEELNFDDLCNIILQIGESKNPEKFRGFVFAEKNSNIASITLGFFIDKEILKVIEPEVIDYIKVNAVFLSEDKFIIGARFILNSLNFSDGDKSFSGLLNNILTIENIEEVEKLNDKINFSVNKIWLFSAEDFSDAEEKRIKVEFEGNDLFEQYKRFLSRRLYSDSKRVVVKPLHGGFSAQTFQVESYDGEKRRMRPTVLKIANKGIIKREADRCSQYAMPYILNNSAIVLGTEFFGEMGALRYNFVGIGGDTTQLKWLTHYFKSMEAKELEPIFDKIFIQILKPWYGQPVRKTIYPFKDHDPTFTFFGNLCDTAKGVLSISSEDKYIEIKETGAMLINPYWYLKYEYDRLRNWNLEYYTSICHGDLNMQNILLDQNMNVYLIDFSETRPRSVVSDFARLEAIFMCEQVEDANADEMKELVEFLFRFYNLERLDKLPENSYHGNYKQQLDKSISMTLKMRSYALCSTSEDPNIIPYYIALLEWVLPIVCYWGAPIIHKKISMIISGIICTKLYNLIEDK